MEHILFTRGAPGADTSSPGQAISNQTTHVIWELALQNSVQSRTSIMLLSAFNVASAAMVLIIGFYDARRLAKNSFLHQGSVHQISLIRIPEEAFNNLSFFLSFLQEKDQAS